MIKILGTQICNAVDAKAGTAGLAPADMVVEFFTVGHGLGSLCTQYLSGFSVDLVIGPEYTKVRRFNMNEI